MPTPERRAPGPAPLRVLGTPRRSLFDAVRPRQVQEAGLKRRGAGGMALAALHHGGVAGTGVADSSLSGGGLAGGGLSGGGGGVAVLGGRAFGRPREGWIAVEDEGRALGVAYGVALTRHRRTLGGQTWCLVRASVLLDGRTLEVAAVLADLPAVRMVPVVVGEAPASDRATALLRACGIDVRRADNDDAWSVLAALDHAGRVAERAPAAVVATRGPVD